VRLLTLTGPAGAGKTRLGLAAGAALARRYADGVCFVDLAPIAEPAQVAPAVARALDLEPETGPEAVERLTRALRQRQILLLLDNFEQVAGAAPDLARLLASCPTLQVLVTSRAPLRLRWEYELPVPPLDVPDLGRLPAPAVLARFPAVRLFVERAGAVDPSFRLDATNAREVAAICARLDGLPLALELAAARADVQTPAEILAGLERNSLAVLAGGAGDLPARQRTLRDAVAWSEALLAPAERRLFRHLSVFAGGCTLEAAAAVAGDVVGEPGLVAPLEGLVRQSLLRRQGDRFRMLEPIRAYAASRLAEEDAGEDGATDAARRHALYYLALAERAAPRLHGPEQVTWLDRLEAERNDLRAALAWSVATGRAEPPGGPRQATARAAAALAVRLAAALGWFWYMRGDRREGLSWLDAVLDLEGASDEPHGPGNGARSTADLVARARALSAAGHLAQYYGDLPGARAHQEAALRLALDVHDPRLVARAAARLGSLCLFTGELDEAGPHLEMSLLRARASADRWTEAFALTVSGALARRQGDSRRAAALSDEGLARFRALGDVWGTAFALQAVAQAAEQVGDFDVATGHWRERLHLSRTLDTTGAKSHALDYLGTLARLQGDLREAAACLAESLVLRREEGDPRAIAWTLNALGDLELARGDLRAARTRYEESLALRLGLKEHLKDDRAGIAATLGGFAGIAAVQGRADPRRAGVALRLAGAGAALARAAGAAPTPLEAETLRRWLAPARERLSPAAQEAAWAAGEQLDLAGAVRLAGATGATGATGVSSPTRPGGATSRLFTPTAASPGAGAPLSQRECEVAALIAQGLTNAEIASRLVITGGTAGSHVAHILAKLGLRSRAQIAAWAVEHLDARSTAGGSPAS
jgi:non-specific serine/threonine protein kinase